MIRIRQSLQQQARIGMSRLSKEGLGVGLFDNLSRIHQRNPMSHVCHHAQIVGDQQQTQLALALQVLEQVQHLLLNRHIKCRGGLIGDQKVGFSGQCHRDHHALLLAATHLEWVAVNPALGLGDANPAQPIDGLATSRVAAQAGVRFNGLHNLIAHPHDGIQTGSRLLKDDADASTSDAAHVGLGQAQQLCWLGIWHSFADGDASTLDATVIWQQAHQGQRRHAFTAARLAHQGIGFAAVERQTQAIQGTDQSGFGIQAHFDIMELQHACSHSWLGTAWAACILTGRCVRARGSKASRTASAKRLADNTTATMNTNAAAKDHHTTGSRDISLRA